MGSIKVLTFGWELAPVMNGGLGVVCKNLTESLSNKGVDITFVIPKFPSEFNNNTNFKLINASNIDINCNLESLSIPSYISPYISSYEYKYIKNNSNKFDSDLYGINLLLEVEKYALRAKELCKNLNIDIIHSHDWMTSVAGVEAKKTLNKPLVFHIHSTEYDRSANNPNPDILKYEKYALDNADKIIAVSKYTKNMIVEKYGIDSKKIHVVHNAVDFTNNDIKPLGFKSSQDKHVLFLARMSVQKGADYLLKAAKKVIEKKNNVKFIFVGNGPILDKLIEMSFDLKINNNVIFTGSLSHDQVDKAYSHADLFVMPSVSEPFGLTPLEAMKNGTPVLISKQSGVSEVIKNCLKVDFWDIDEMASKILSILYNEPLSLSLSKNGYHDINQLTWSRQADKVIEVYQELI